jgi:hypothetical protein
MANQVKTEKVAIGAGKDDRPKVTLVKVENKPVVPTPQAKADVKKPMPKPLAEAKEPSAQPKPEPAEQKTQPDILAELADIRQTLIDHSNQIAEIREVLSRKRKPVNNSKVQIKDKTTGKVYPSKNNCYQSLLKAGELTGLVKKGVFGSDPEHNTFGWYALNRELPDRFEEIKEA